MTVEKFTTYQPRPDLLAERVVLVTGASEGIGAALAEATGRLGATVVLVARTVAKLEAVQGCGGSTVVGVALQCDAASVTRGDDEGARSDHARVPVASLAGHGQRHVGQQSRQQRLGVAEADLEAMGRRRLEPSDLLRGTGDEGAGAFDHGECGR